MVYAGEKVPNIALQDPAIGGLVLVPVVGHEALQQIQAVVHPFVNLGSAVGRDEAVGDRFIERVINQGVLDHLIDEGRGLDQPLLRLIDEEGLKLSGLVGIGVQDIGCLLYTFHHEDEGSGHRREELGVHLALHEVGHGLFHHAGDAHGVVSYTHLDVYKRQIRKWSM